MAEGCLIFINLKLETIAGLAIPMELTLHDYTYGLLLYGDIVNAFAFALYTLHYRPQATKFNLMVVGYRACRELTTCSSTALKPSKLTLTMVQTTAAQLSSSREGLRV